MARTGRPTGEDVGAAQPGRPRKKRVPWVRRIVSTTILLLVLVALVFGVVKLGGWVKGVLSEEHSRTTEVATIKPVVIDACTPQDLTISVTPNVVSVQEGQGFNVAVSLVNKGAEDCSFDLSTLMVILDGAGGAVWTPTACSAAWDKSLLLGAGKSWSTTLTWDGLVYADCAQVQNAGGAATPMEGQYALKWSAPPIVSSKEVAVQVY